MPLRTHRDEQEGRHQKRGDEEGNAKQEGAAKESRGHADQQRRAGLEWPSCDELKHRLHKLKAALRCSAQRWSCGAAAPMRPKMRSHCGTGRPPCPAALQAEARRRS